jgi:hypothetical protein
MYIDSFLNYINHKKLLKKKDNHMKDEKFKPDFETETCLFVEMKQRVVVNVELIESVRIQQY